MHEPASEKFGDVCQNRALQLERSGHAGCLLHSSTLTDIILCCKKHLVSVELKTLAISKFSGKSLDRAYPLCMTSRYAAKICGIQRHEILTYYRTIGASFRRKGNPAFHQQRKNSLCDAYRNSGPSIPRNSTWILAFSFFF